jgi:hypothetical protein
VAGNATHGGEIGHDRERVRLGYSPRVNANGKRRPPRPRLEISAASASPEEAAAITAALERFLADTAPPPSAGSAPNPWQRAALIEGVSAKRRAFPGDPGSGLPLT